jgi:hypothetical protein
MGYHVKRFTKIVVLIKFSSKNAYSSLMNQDKNSGPYGTNSIKKKKLVDAVMVSVLASSIVNDGFEPQSG